MAWRSHPLEKILFFLYEFWISFWAKILKILFVEL
jgi:hypothetical protein